MKPNSSLSSQNLRSQCGRVRRPLLVVVGLFAVGGGALWWLRDSPGAPAVAKSPPPASASGAAAVETPEVVARRVVSADESGSDNPRAAQIAFEGARRVVAPNVRGEFPRVSVPAAAVIRATVPFPGLAPGAMVFLQAEDGGALQGAASGGELTVGEDQRVTLEFRAAASDGVQRVTLRHGTDTRLLEFWVGPEAPVLVRNGE